MCVGSNRAEMQPVPESLGLLMDPAPKQHRFGGEVLQSWGLLEATLAMQGATDAVEHFTDALCPLAQITE